MSFEFIRYPRRRLHQRRSRRPPANWQSLIVERARLSQKVANAKAVGALGALIINNVAGDPIAMARTAGFDDDLPAVMLSQADGATLRSSGATTASADSTFQQFFTNGQNPGLDSVARAD